MTTLALIAAIARDGAIGKAGGLPWPTLRGDRRWFKAITTSGDPRSIAVHWCYYPHTVAVAGALGRTVQNAVIMGRRTWESLPTHLVDRDVIVLTKDPRSIRGAGFTTAETLGLALGYAQHERCPHAFIIGGAQVYVEALEHQDLQTLYLTEVDEEYPDADTSFPAIWLAEDDMPEQRVTKRQPDGTLRHWRRTHVSAWIEEPDAPRYRFGIWEKREET